MKTTIIVYKCKECVFRHNSECLHPSEPLERYAEGRNLVDEDARKDFPDWCPLYTTVVIKEETKES